MDEQVIERVKAVAADYIREHDIELVDVIYRREQQGMVLRLIADAPGGIRLDQCEDLNNFMSDALDREGVIEGHYILEVASPGLDRPLKSDRDFERVMEKDIELTTYEPINERRTHEGRLVSVDKENIIILSKAGNVTIPRNKIAKAVLKIEF